MPLAQQEGEELPEGWVGHAEPSGKLYYVNEKKHITTWTRPLPPVQDVDRKARRDLMRSVGRTAGGGTVAIASVDRLDVTGGRESGEGKNGDSLTNTGIQLNPIPGPPPPQLLPPPEVRVDSGTGRCGGLGAPPPPPGGGCCEGGGGGGLGALPPPPDLQGRSVARSDAM